MNAKRRRNLIQLAELEQAAVVTRRRRCLIIAGVLLVVAAFATFLLWPAAKPPPKETAKINVQPPRTLEELLQLKPDQLEEIDIALMNLLCAKGLLGAEDLNVSECLERLDGMAKYIKTETARHFYKFREHPEQYRNSIGYYRMMMLGTVLVKDLGIRYNPEMALPQMDGKIPTLGEGANSKDVFIHGLLDGKHFGTCASMPVLVVALGRRLGYPVNLAGAKYHRYVRYEEPDGNHFNVEPTVTEGFLTPEDEDYKNGQFKTSDEEVKGYNWLQPLSNGQALSSFLNTRAICLGNAKRYDESKQMFLLAASFWQETPQRKKSLDYYLQAVKEAPLGDQLYALWTEIEKLEVPQGSRSAYFKNRKVQIHYFMSANTNLPAIEKAGNDFKNELAEYRRQLASGDPALLKYQQHKLVINLKSGKSVRLPVAALPPPLNRGSLPPGYIERILELNLEDSNAIINALWSYHKQTALDWMGEAALLPSW